MNFRKIPLEKHHRYSVRNHILLLQPYIINGNIPSKIQAIATIIQRLSPETALMTPITPNITANNGSINNAYNVMLATKTHCSIDAGLERCIIPLAYLSKLYIQKRLMMPQTAETIDDDLYVSLP